MRSNPKAPATPQPLTHEGAPAARIKATQQLRRSVMSCMLFEGEFYESGQSIYDRIASLIPRVDPINVVAIALEARNRMKLRHVPLAIAREMLRHEGHRQHVSNVLENVIQRPDELCEFLAMYWKGESDPKTPLAKQAKLGLAYAFNKFDAHQLAKYNNQDRQFKLRDVMFLVHPKPKDKEQADTFKRLAENTLPTPDTWEVALSASKGEDKKGLWERFLIEGRLGGLALLRNLRNFHQAGVDVGLVSTAISRMKTDRILPFRFITAARYAPQLEGALEEAMFRCLLGMPKLPGCTVLLVDVSGSMDGPLSYRPDGRGSEATRMDAACGLAVLARELCEEAVIFTFSNQTIQIPDNRHGFSLRDKCLNSQLHSGTRLGAAVRHVENETGYDRLIVITDEQSQDTVPEPSGLGYIINVASAQNGVGYGRWNHIDGWAESVLDYIRVSEDLQTQEG